MLQVANVTPEYSDESHVTLPHFFVCCPCVNTHVGRCKCTCVNGHVAARVYLWVLGCIILYLYFWGFSVTMEVSLNGWTGFYQAPVTTPSVSPELGLQEHAITLSLHHGHWKLESLSSHGKHFPEPSPQLSHVTLIRPFSFVTFISHKLMACRELESMVLFNGFSCVWTLHGLP